MSETQRHVFNLRRACYFCIAGACVLLLIVFVVRFLASDPVRHDPEPVKVKTFPPPRRDARTPPPVFEVSETYHRTIIDNNLFRPLGWTLPRPIEPYRLIGTILASDETTPPQAILQSTTGHQTYFVTLGSNIDANTQVVDIQSKQVTLSTQGRQRTLMLPIGF